MRKQITIICLMLVSLCVTSACEGKDKVEVPVENAIKIAAAIAKKKKYDTESADIEVMKVKKGIERGPIRLVWLMQYFPKEERKILFENEFWIVYFYPKGDLEKSTVLDGEFCALVELYSGKVLTAFKVP